MLASAMLLYGMRMTTLDSTQINLDTISQQAFVAAQQKFIEDKLLPEDVGISIYLINRPAETWVRGGYRADQAMYPASVVKMFYMAYAAHLLDTGELVSTPEFERAASDMIRDSNNDATGYMIDRICGTTPGPEMDEQALAEFGEKRRSVNRWFSTLGYEKVNAVQRTYNEGPYGRESQWLGENLSNRNSLTPESCARLMAEIALEKLWKPESSKWMKDLLHRNNPQDDFENADGQAMAYIGRVIPAGTKLYSKAGWTSNTRHDAAWLVMPDGMEYAISIFSTRGNNLQLVSFIAARILSSLGYQIKEPEGDPVVAELID